MNLLKNLSCKARLAPRQQLPGRFFAALVATGLGLSAALAQPTQAPSSAPTTTAVEPARKTSFSEVTSQLDPGGNLYLYLATDRWLAGLSSNIFRVRDFIKSLPDVPAANREQVDRVFDLVSAAVRGSGIENLTGVGLSGVQFTPDLYRSKLVLHHKAGEGRGLLWGMFGRQAHPLRAMDMLPKTTALAAFGDFDLARTWNIIAGALANSGLPDVARGLREWEQNFEQGTTLSWTNVLASFGGEVGVILTLDDARKVSLPVGSEFLEMPEPGLIVAVKIKDDTLYTHFSQELKEKAQATVTEEPGLKLCVVPLGLPLPIRVQPTLASSGDYLFAASSPELVRAVLSARSGAAPGLAKSPEFTALRQYLPAEGNQFFYAGRPFSAALLEIQKRALQSSDAPPMAMPLIQQLLFDKEPSVGLVVSGSTPTGWQVVSVGNKDSSGAMLLAPVAGGVAVPAAMLLPALSRAKARAQSINCQNNLKQIGLAFKVWALDNQDQFPFNVATNKGGTMELCARGEGGFDANAFRHFQVMSNELSTPKILVCAADPARQPATDFGSLKAENVTYQVRSGPDLNDSHPQEVLARCPVHGNELLCDGSVRRGRPNK